MNDPNNSLFNFSAPIKENRSKGSSAVEEVIAYIEKLIFSGKLKPGSKLFTENELCNILGVSRTAVREAIMYFESLTVVEVIQGSGTYIAHPNKISFVTPLKYKIKLGDVSWREIIEFRKQFDFMILKEAIIHATNEELDKLWHLSNELIALKDKPSPYLSMYKNEIQFHNTLVVATHNKLLAINYEFLSEVFNLLIFKLYKYYEKHNTLIVDDLYGHRRYVKALQKRDVMLAYYLISQGKTVEDWLKILEGETFESFFGI